MKKIIVIAFVAAFSFGFTLTSDSKNGFDSDCPYLNKIHSEQNADANACPYSEGKASNKSNMKSSECPYTGGTIKSESDCPYINEQNNKVNEEEIIPRKMIKLKSS
ncbi:MAG: hypothetical protein U5K00_19545 [Melioribacteraceae bacterium]|nr:hypothetical protein [Melioribacteraceae bacterium]